MEKPLSSPAQIRQEVISSRWLKEMLKGFCVFSWIFVKGNTFYYNAYAFMCTNIYIHMSVCLYIWMGVHECPYLYVHTHA